MGMPKPGSQEFENMIDFMRKDLESGMGYSNLIEQARKNIENSMQCNRCGNIWERDKDSTGYCEKCGSADVKYRNFEESFEKWKESKNG